MARPTPTSTSVFLNVPLRPVAWAGSQPRLVENFMEPGTRTYSRAGDNTGWNDSPSSSAQITWGGASGQWFEVSTLAAGEQQVYVQAYFYRIRSAKYVLSFDVVSKSGTIGGGVSAKVHATSGLSGITSVSDPAVGRHALVFTATASGDAWIRLGIGQDSANAADATIRYANVMLEVWVDPATTSPSEYVNPGDTRAFPYTRSVTMDGTLVDTVTHGTSYAIPRHTSVLVVGDSFTDNKASEPVGTNWGDFPYRMKRRELAGRKMAICTRGVGGQTLSQIKTQIENALAETTYTDGVAPWSACVLEGGINDVIAGRTLAQMQADKLAQIELCLANNMVPVLVGLAPYNSANGTQQTLIDNFNAWLRTLSYPLYDLYADANDGNGDYKASWGSPDGTHPGTAFNNGQAFIARRLTNLLPLIG